MRYPAGRQDGIVDGTRTQPEAEETGGAHHARNARRVLRALAHAAWLLCAAVALLLLAASLPLGYALLFRGVPVGRPVDAPDWYVALFGFIYGAVSLAAALLSLGLGILMFWKRRDEPIALLTSFYLLSYGIIMAGPLEALNGFRPLPPPPATSESGLLVPPESIWHFQSILLLPSVLLLYLFPNGRFVPTWMRWAALPLLLLVFPAFVLLDYRLPLQTGLVLGVLASLIVAGLVAQGYRYRRVATPVERQQIKWVAWGYALAFVIMGVGFFPYMTISTLPAESMWPAWVPPSQVLWWLAVSINPVCLAVAVMRHRLWDIDVILNRSLVYGSLTAIIVVLNVLASAGLSGLVHTEGSLLTSLLVTAGIAVMFQPLRERLQRGVNRLMYGERDDPYAVIARLGQRLEATLAPDAVLPAIVETVAQALKVPYAAIQVTENGMPSGDAERAVPIAAEHGQPQREVVSVPLIYQAETIGQLLVAPRAPGEAFSAADRQLLANVARQAGVAAHSVRLTADLQRSRERLVSAREEERRRLRRDLHDGLGPALAAQTLKAGSARALYPRDPAAADALLTELERDGEAALADIRRLVYNLRPPALDELGLAGAVREQAAQYRGGALTIQVETPALPPLPAAVEVAAYRIVQEAVANVVRHAGARHCFIRLALDGALTVTVTDDGRGIAPAHRAGVGLASMRERAAELGGSCTVEAAARGGTRVVARLPVEARR